MIAEGTKQYRVADEPPIYATPKKFLAVAHALRDIWMKFPVEMSELADCAKERHPFSEVEGMEFHEWVLNPLSPDIQPIVEIIMEQYPGITGGSQFLKESPPKSINLDPELWHEIVGIMNSPE